MYCPTCGKSVNADLKYCNGCGERIGKGDEDKDGTAGKMLEQISTTLCVVVVFGFGILVGLVAVLLGNEVKIELVGIIVVAYLAAIFGICFTLVRQIPKLIDAKLKPLTNPPQTATPSHLAPPTTAQLEEYREPAMSVTDHTTRALEEIPILRK